MKITTDDIVSALRRAAFYEAREAELHYRAALRAEIKRRRSAKGRQRAVAQRECDVLCRFSPSPSRAKR